MNTTDLMGRIDWPKLREQKAALLSVAERSTGDLEHKLMGIVHLIDVVQDVAVLDGFASTAEVFGEDDES